MGVSEPTRSLPARVRRQSRGDLARGLAVGGAWYVVLTIALGVSSQGGGADSQSWQGGRWQPAVGRWQVEEPCYVQGDERTWGAWTLWGEGLYADVDVRVQFKIEPMGRGVRAAGIVFRAADAHHFFYAHFDSKNDQLLITRWAAGFGAKHLARIRRIGLRQGMWHRARVQCVGRHVRVYLDGRQIGEATGVNLLAGQVGLRTGQGRVRYRNWQVEGTPTTAVGAPKAEPSPWWNAAWRWRLPVLVRELGRDDREAAIARVRINLDGRARVFGTIAPGRPCRTDVVVVGPERRATPARVVPVGVVPGGAGIREADVWFPVHVNWLGSARYFAYFGNPNAVYDPKRELQMNTFSFAALATGRLPEGWKFAGGEWRMNALSRPARNRSRVAAVASSRHVAFPGICMTKRGTLIAVYREGYSHASGNPDDGRIMLVRSTDKGRTWSEPELAYDDPTMDDRNAAIACMNDGTLCLIWDKYLHGRHHWAWMRVSTDEGRTWSAPVKVSKDENVHTRSRPLDLGDGRWLIPYSESTHGRTTATYFSIYDPKAGFFEEIAATPRGQRNIADEVAVTRAADGNLVALIRSNTDPTLWKIVSKDNGRTWSPARPTNIPSQFTPADLITLKNGWLLCSFSFRERRNERLVVSRDNGETWDVENSVDVFAGTAGVGGDRSYPASVQIDDETIGTVLYETRTPPAGGHIWFVTTKFAALAPPKETVLYQANIEAENAFALWPSDLRGETIECAYRFTGLFGPGPNVVGLLLSFRDPRNYAAFEFQMGSAPNRKAWPVNYVQLVQCLENKRKTLHGRTAQGGWFDDGNVHRLGARRKGNQWVLMIDGIDQFAVPDSMGKPCGILARRAALAAYDIASLDHSVQMDSDALEIRASALEHRKDAE